MHTPNIVVIVGKPNVGKSTLFNRLIEKQEAIIDNMPGVTRDRHYEVATWRGYTFTLIDTGGYIEKTRNDIDAQIKQQINIALEEASVILFVVDCKEGMTAEDLLLGDMLRKSDKPVITVANKADNPKMAAEASIFYQLGLKDMYEVSAAHGTGTGDLLDGMVPYLDKKSGEDGPSLPKIAFIGRTNTGKSTFLNALLRQPRSIVHQAPHTTRTSVHSHYNLYDKELIVIDTAGIARKKQIKKNSVQFYSLIRTVKAIDQADVCVMLLDAKEQLTKQDKNILALVHRKRKGIVLLINKWDQEDHTEKHVEAYKKALEQSLAHLYYMPVLFTSGLQKHNIHQTLEKALEVYKNRQKKIPTPLLNKFIQKVLLKNPLPSPKGHALKINYVRQEQKAPWPIFVLFCNHPEYVPSNYKRYLEKQIRSYYTLEGVPISLVFKHKHKMS